MKLTKIITAGLALALAVCLPACTSNKPAADGTVTISIVSDPGALDPQQSIVAGIFEMSFYAYDSLVGLNPKGEILPQLAKSWTLDGLTATFELNEGITCSDGSAFTASTVARNIAWYQDFDNASPYLGVFMPVGIEAVADDAAGTVTLTLAGPEPFLLSALANVPLVCDSGLDNRDQLQAATLGSGPYVLTEAVPDDHYTYERRDGYTWGPGGATTDEPGLPKTLVVRVVPNESTEVNLLLAGEVNIATTTGVDADRAVAAGIPFVDIPAVLGTTWYNHEPGHPTADEAVRIALTQAVDLDQLATVITGGTGGRATAMAVIPPAACSFDSVTGNLPTFDVAAAGATLEAAGFAKDANGKYGKDGQPLVIAFLYDSVLGTEGQAAAELAVQQWEAAGFTIDVSSLETAQIAEVLFGTGDWDVAWEPVNVNSPDQFVGFLTGPGLAEGGMNFTGINNPGYDAAVEDAMGKSGQEACQAFQQAEAALFAAADQVTWAVRPNKIFTNGIDYEYIGRTQVTSLRVH